ncbi:hypothetical protein MJ8_30450 [Mesorhizobium sp. J8]|nr:hypothetical protein MJ8_30450 [Mesorhizobium sp. J8]
MENLKAVLTPIIDRGLRIVGAVSLAVIAGFLVWWLL